MAQTKGTSSSSRVAGGRATSSSTTNKSAKKKSDYDKLDRYSDLIHHHSNSINSFLADYNAWKTDPSYSSRQAGGQTFQGSSQKNGSTVSKPGTHAKTASGYASYLRQYEKTKDNTRKNSGTKTRAGSKTTKK